MILLLPTAFAADLLFVGNSYIFVNALDEGVDTLLEAGQAAYAASNTVRLAKGGYTFADHVTQAGTDGTEWQANLTDTDGAWDWVFLQEQSQIPGFPRDNSQWIASRDAAAALDDLAEARGAETFFLLTWGRRAGDDTNPDLYPDFPTMQAALTDGYTAYRDATSTAARPTWIAPVGPAFSAVYAESAAAGDPLDPAGKFYRLYSDDGSHPSPLGTYLAACVIYASVTGHSPEGLAPMSGVPDQDAEWPQALAWAVVSDNSLEFTYPSPTPEEIEDDPTDTGGADAAHDDDSEDDAPACGCTTSSDIHGFPTAVTLPIAVVLLALKRRRRRADQGATLSRA